MPQFQAATDPRDAVTNTATWLPWLRFGDAVRTGHSQAHNAHGMGFFYYLDQRPLQATEFITGMSSGTSAWAPALAAQIDTTNVRRAVDIGGANGALLTLLQKANPALTRCSSAPGYAAPRC